mmetsp:Transcript_24058/g.71408  ORF Transcript_24058/g.71408 Transcript_24058/m.71408 type:complete len:228 (+) Transcript_24058:1635-2318(+)
MKRHCTGVSLSTTAAFSASHCSRSPTSSFTAAWPRFFHSTSCRATTSRFAATMALAMCNSLACCGPLGISSARCSQFQVPTRSSRPLETDATAVGSGATRPWPIWKPKAPDGAFAAVDAPLPPVPLPGARAGACMCCAGPSSACLLTASAGLRPETHGSVLTPMPLLVMLPLLLPRSLFWLLVRVWLSCARPPLVGLPCIPCGDPACCTCSLPCGTASAAPPVEPSS